MPGAFRPDQSSRRRGRASRRRSGSSCSDGRSLLPERIWSDAKADIAVLKLDRDDLPAARMGNSDDAAVGSWVMALGSPFGLTHSVSQGIISARGRHMDELQDVENQDFLQTDAAINPGNSGGPLVNMKGEVIGINNSIASNGGGNEGVGFSIPINLARWIMNELIVHGRVTAGRLGVDPADRLPPGGRRRRWASSGREAPGSARSIPSSPAVEGGPARRRRRPPLRRGRDRRSQPPDQHGLDGPDRSAGRGGRLARPPRADVPGDRRRARPDVPAARGAPARAGDGSVGTAPPPESARRGLELRDGAGAGDAHARARHADGAARELARCPGRPGRRRRARSSSCCGRAT